MPSLKISTLVAALALGLTACGGPESDSARTELPPYSAPTAEVGLAALSVLHSAPASVIALERVEVASRLMGYLRDIAVAEGQRVARGERLFTVDPVDVEGQVEQARLAVRLAEAAHADARADFERFDNLFKEEAVSRQQYDKIKLQSDSAAARLAQAQAGLATATGQLRYAAVTAPIAGVVTRKLAEAGDLASPGRPVLVIENPARLQVETQVPQAVMTGLKLGQTIRVEVDGLAAPIDATVARLSPAADPVSRTFLVKLDIAASGLHSGAFARALFPLGERAALQVPASALVTRAGIEGLFVVDSEGRAQFRMVRSGARHGDQVEIQAGLEAGERIVTANAATLQSGQAVRD